MKTNEILDAASETDKALVGSFKGNNRKLAKQALELCKEWAMINKSQLESKDKKTSKKECKAYVKENLKPVGSIFIMILTGILVRLIVDWIVNNFIYNLKK